MFTVKPHRWTMTSVCVCRGGFDTIVTAASHCRSDDNLQLSHFAPVASEQRELCLVKWDTDDQ